MPSKYSLLIQDFLTGKNVAGLYDMYAKTQWLSESEMHEYKLAKLKNLLNHCYSHVPYYRKFMISSSIHPDDITDIAQISEFPILDKQVIKANYSELTPDNLQHLKHVKESFTGGTTGEPLKKRTDANTRSSTWGAYKRFYDWMEIKGSDRSLNLMGGFDKSSSYRQRLVKSFLDLLNNSISIDTYDSFSHNMDTIISVLADKRIRLLRGYPQFVYSVAQKLQQMGHTYSLKAVMTTAEPLFPQHRELFRTVFGCETFDQYGCGEIGGIAFECSAHEGLHVTEERVILETNAKGEMLITDLDNYAMPYIRYWNADEADIGTETCSCGRKSKLIKQIRGRVVDYLYGAQGQQLHSSYIWKIMFESGIAQKCNLQRFQLIQKAIGSLEFHIVSDLLSLSDRDAIHKYLSDKLGDLEVIFFQDAEIQNASSGKYRPIIGMAKPAGML